MSASGLTTAASIDHHTVTRDALERDPEFMWAYVKQLYTEFEEAQSSLTASGDVVAAAKQWKADLAGIVDCAEDLNMDAEKKLWAAVAELEKVNG